MELFVLANWAKALTYCSATFKFTASAPPGACIAAAVLRIASALACAIDKIAAACPSARLIEACFSPSDLAIDASR